jgi:hypothetical protein
MAGGAGLAAHAAGGRDLARRAGPRHHAAAPAAVRTATGAARISARVVKMRPALRFIAPASIV